MTTHALTGRYPNHLEFASESSVAVYDGSVDLLWAFPGLAPGALCCRSHTRA